MVDESRVRAVWLQEKLSASTRNEKNGGSTQLGDRFLVHVSLVVNVGQNGEDSRRFFGKGSY